MTGHGRAGSANRGIVPNLTVQIVVTRTKKYTNKNIHCLWWTRCSAWHCPNILYLLKLNQHLVHTVISFCNSLMQFDVILDF